MNPVLTLVYSILYTLVKTGLELYYRIEPPRGLPEKEPVGPLIILGNHPNALIDPFMVVSRLKRPVFFLGNASLFNHWFANWFLNTFYCIPIERPKDVGGRPIDNAQAFQRSRQHLLQGGALYIAPEGTSEREYRLRPIKTGAARIALDVLQADPTQRMGFLLGGITYQEHPAFRSQVSLHFDHCEISVSDLPGPVDDWSTVEWLTRLLEDKMQALLLHSEPEIDHQLMRCTRLLQPGLAGPHWRDDIHAILKRLRQMGARSESVVSALSACMAEKELTKVDPQWTGQRERTGRLILLPIVALILVHYLFIYGLPEFLKRSLHLHPVYDATVRFLGGLIGYLIGVPLLWWAMHWVMPGVEYRIIWLVVVLALGPWAWQEMLFFQRCRHWWAFRRAAQDTGWLNRFHASLAPLTGQAV